jgi:hypothetical protein
MIFVRSPHWNKTGYGRIPQVRVSRRVILLLYEALSVSVVY